jgi:hypothetical protein
MTTSARRVAAMAGRGAGVLALLALVFVALNWYRYGRVSSNGKRDPLLDVFMPSYEVREYHEVRVAAPVELAYDALRAMDINRSRLVRGIFRARELALRGDHEANRQPRSLLEETHALGWGVLTEEPGHEIIVGAVTQPWAANVRLESLAPDEFAAFDEPGYVKIAWTLSAESVDSRSSIVATETRVASTDKDARDRFRRYWAVVSPGVRLIRVEGLRLVRADAERRYRERDLLPSGSSPAVTRRP